MWWSLCKRFTSNLAKLSTVECRVDRVTFMGKQSLRYSRGQLMKTFAVLRCREQDGNRIVVTGLLPREIDQGHQLRILGHWVTHSKYGEQFQAQMCTIVNESQSENFSFFSEEQDNSMAKLIGNGIFPGIGRGIGERIVEEFGQNKVIDVILDTPEKLRKVKGVGQRIMNSIDKGRAILKHMRTLLEFLHHYNLPLSLALRLVTQLNASPSDIVKRIKENPYSLILDVPGVGFRRADDIARKIGISPTSPTRVEAALTDVLRQSLASGNTYRPEPNVLRTSQKLLEIDQYDVIVKQLNAMIKSKQVAQIPTDEEDKGIGFPHILQLEKRLSRLFLSRGGRSEIASEEEIENALVNFEQPLSEEQRQAVIDSCTYQFLIVKGGAGVGKSYCTNAIIKTWQALGLSCLVMAPTGRAASRLSEFIGQEAFTIHRALGKYSSDNFDDFQGILVDETSMLDIQLCEALLSSIRSTTRLVFVGDPNQLPSIGPGNILGDLIQSKCFKIATLTHIFRRSARNSISTVTAAINEGIVPRIQGFDKNNCDQVVFLNHPKESASEILIQELQDLCKTKFGQLGIDPLEQVQFLSPMLKGPLGVDHLNTLLAQWLNPSKRRNLEYCKGLAKGDRMIQLKNDYKNDVFNGDLGHILAIHETSFVVDFDSKILEYSYDLLNKSIQVAYCISVHKSQGSEFDVIVLPILFRHSILLSRRLLYTAMTRAKKLLVLIGSNACLAMTTSKEEAQGSKRYSSLKLQLQDVTCRSKGSDDFSHDSTTIKAKHLFSQ